MNANAVNASSRSRVRENFMHGSVGVVMASELNLNLKLWRTNHDFYQTKAQSRLSGLYRFF
jgi:hypothetical protein